MDKAELFREAVAAADHSVAVNVHQLHLLRLAGLEPNRRARGDIKPLAVCRGTIKPQRDCQTLLTCNFKKGGSYRGCLSSYSCRSCDFVIAKCSIAGSKGKVCRQLRCGWGA